MTDFKLVGGGYGWYMDVEPKIVGKPPKWMGKIMENPIKMDDLGGNTPILGNTHIGISQPEFFRCLKNNFGLFSSCFTVESWNLINFLSGNAFRF